MALMPSVLSAREEPFGGITLQGALLLGDGGLLPVADREGVEATGAARLLAAGAPLPTKTSVAPPRAGLDGPGDPECLALLDAVTPLPTSSAPPTGGLDGRGEHGGVPHRGVDIPEEKTDAGLPVTLAVVTGRDGDRNPPRAHACPNGVACLEAAERDGGAVKA